MTERRTQPHPEMECECEHISHMDDCPANVETGHPYMKYDESVMPVRTDYGTYDLCATCRNLQHLVNYNGRTGPHSSRA